MSNSLEGAHREGDWGPWLGIDPDTGKRTVQVTPVWHRVGDFERAVVFQPGYRSDRKTYGQHGMDMRWLLRGDKGVTQFVLYSGWVPGLGAFTSEKVYAPMGADVGYHALVPQYEGAEDYGRECDYLDGRTCYYDGSALAAEDLLSRFLIEGEEIVWQTLIEWYDRLVTCDFAPGDE